MQSSEARERVMRAAETLFAERGYTAVTVKDIAASAGIHHASLYHHAPKGKEQLYVEVTARLLNRHAEGMRSAIAAGGDLRGQFRAIAAWLISQPPMDLVRMVHSDAPALSPGTAEQLYDMAFESLLMPIFECLYQAGARGEVADHDTGNIGGALFSALEGLHTLPAQYRVRPLQQMADEIIEMFLRGLGYRSAS
jgi:TetR/AcrR family transcriptional regulator, cholesterol catabolism regulator